MLNPDRNHPVTDCGCPTVNLDRLLLILRHFDLTEDMSSLTKKAETSSKRPVSLLKPAAQTRKKGPFNINLRNYILIIGTGL